MPELRATTTLADAASVVAEPAAAWLPDPVRPSGPDTWLVDLHLGRLHRRARVQVGPAVRDPSGVHRHLAWSSTEEPGDALPFEALLPAFDGHLTADGDTLELVGSYDPPAGPIGRVADLALRRLAARTVQTLLDEIARRAQHVDRVGGS